MGGNNVKHIVVDYNAHGGKVVSPRWVKRTRFGRRQRGSEQIMQE